MQHPNSDQRILVTGATGLLGSYLLRYLVQRGYTQLRALRQPFSHFDMLEDIRERIEWVDADILDLPALEEAILGRQWVFHCAGIVSFDPRDARLMRQVNVDGTANVVDLCLIHKVDKLVHVSSVAALGRSRPGQTISEQSRWERSPLNTRYGISKFLGEQEVWRGIEEGLNAVIINPSIILGSGRWDEGPARFFKMLHRGFSFYPRGGTDLVDVRDVVRMMVELMEGDFRNERFIASAGHLTYEHFFGAIARGLGKPAPNRSISPLLQRILWRLAWIQARFSKQRSLVTRETVRQSAMEFYYDQSKSIRLLGFEYIPVEQTIAETAQRFLESASENSSAKLLPFPFAAGLSLQAKQ